MVERGREDRKRIRMRTYRNLYAEFISDENIKLAIQNFEYIKPFIDFGKTKTQNFNSRQKGKVY